MDVWESSSDGRRQTFLSAACLAVGVLLIISLHDFGASGSSRQAGFLLGMVLALLGAASLAVSGRQTVLVDSRKCQISIHDHRLVGHKIRTIAFSEVVDVQVAYLQTRSRQVLQYFLQLQLRNGEAYPLFAPGRVYIGSSDPAIVAGWKTRLLSLIHISEPTRPY